MKKKDVIVLSKSLNGVLNEDKESSLKFKYACIKMAKALEGEINALTKVEEDITKLTSQFEKERLDIFEKYGDRNEKGYSLREENINVAQKELQELVVKHKDAIEENSKRWVEYNQFLEEDVDISLNKIDLALFPDWISAKDLAVFSNLDLILESEE